MIYVETYSLHCGNMWKPMSMCNMSYRYSMMPLVNLNFVCKLENGHASKMAKSTISW